MSVRISHKKNRRTVLILMAVILLLMVGTVARVLAVW